MLRDELRQRVAQSLEPGEQLRQVFVSQTGVSPMLIPLIGPLIALLVNTPHVVAVTDRNICLFRTSKWVPSKLKSTTPERLPLQVLDLKGKLWSKADIGGQTHYISRLSFSDEPSPRRPLVNNGP